MSETRIHPVTGKPLKRGSRPYTVQVGDRRIEVMLGGWYPDDDSDAIHSGADLKVIEDTERELSSKTADRTEDE